MPRSFLLLAALSACQGRSADPDAAAGDDAADVDDDSTGYAGPDYAACVSDAQCEPGSWCTTVPDHASPYCAPPCDPNLHPSAGAGSECDPDGTLGFAVACMENGRCARVCEEDQVASVDPETGALLASPDDTCPETLECMLAGEEEELPVCAGPAAGKSGYYGLCSHPNVEGTDCPSSSSCFGGSYIGLDDVGVCLPWCDDNTCPAVPDGVVASPLCYDAGLDHPVCALLCTPGSGICPEGQVCEDISGFGLCLPEGSDLGYY